MAGGRPTIMTSEVLKKLEDAFLIGCSDVEACFVADISPQTLYNYQKEYPEFVERKEALKSNPVFIARKSVITEMATKGELALKFLERKAKAEFSSSTDINLGGQEGKPVEISLTGILNDINGRTADLPDKD